MATRINLGFLNGYAPSWAERIVQGSALVLGHPVDAVDLEMDLPRYYSADRGQYNATLILAGLLRHHSDPDSKIVGITRVDLFIPVLTFVFGQAQLDGPGALVSTHRLRSEYYGLPRDRERLVERTIKEVVHEVGHSFGLVHCPDYNCVMHAATYVEDVDLKSSRFCPSCEAQLQVDVPRPPQTA
ncbi:MAG: archaemetzincin family Zn-dependent metalloprotease [marine benthic group bacterium]|nr:archaemetzincin family Zn-dependent metalloprotease [Gemmatimonadota bacterium]